MKKLNGMICFLLVSVIAVEICIPMDPEIVRLPVSVPPSPLQLLVGFMSSSFGRRTPEGSEVASPVQSTVGNASFSSSASELSADKVARPRTPLQSFLSAVSKRDNLQPWQRSLVEQIHQELHGFECIVSGNGAMKVTGDFLVGERSWAVYAVNGKKTKRGEDITVKEETVPWAPTILVTPTQKKGLYDIEIQTPKPTYFESVNMVMVPVGTCRNAYGAEYPKYEKRYTSRSGKRYSYKDVSDLASFFRRTDVHILRPNSPIYSE